MILKQQDTNANTEYTYILIEWIDESNIDNLVVFRLWIQYGWFICIGLLCVTCLLFYYWVLTAQLPYAPPNFMLPVAFLPFMYLNGLIAVLVLSF